MTAMTPDKVEAALGVLRGGRRSPHCDESRPAGIVFVGEEVSAYDYALSVLTEALAERGAHKCDGFVYGPTAEDQNSWLDPEMIL